MSLRTRLVLFIVAILAIAPVSAQDVMMTIDFWHGLTGPDGVFLEDMVNTYNETNEDGIFVQLNVFHWDVFFDRWVASVATGDPPMWSFITSTKCHSMPKTALSHPLKKSASI